MTNFIFAQVPFLTALVFAPLLSGVINKTKAFYGGRKGISLFQQYYDISKLFKKDAVYSSTTSWIFKVAPLLSFSVCFFAVILFSPFGAGENPLSFAGDFILLIYLFALSRFFTVIAALDTGSSFEGMGVSRELQFAFFAEFAFFLSFMAISCFAKNPSINGAYAALHKTSILISAPTLMVAVSLFMVMLVENCRIPADDPNTHLELTMIHEVMVLDYGGPDFGFILYASALKLWFFASLIVSLLLPVKTGNLAYDFMLFMSGIFVIGLIIGSVESIMARFRFEKVQRLLIFAGILSLISLLLVAIGGE